MLKRFRSYCSKLNWSGFFFLIIICMIGVTSNDNVNSIGQWLMLMGIGMLFALFFLFAGKED